MTGIMEGVWWWKRSKFRLLCACIFVFLATKSVNCSDDFENELSPDLEDVIDDEINNMDNPNKTNNYGGYILGRFVHSLVKLSDVVNYVPNRNGGRTGRMYHDNTTMYGNNSMWDQLFKFCGAKTALACVKKTVYTYIDRSVLTDQDFAVTDGVIFTRHGRQLFENKYDRSINEMAAEVNNAAKEPGKNESDINEKDRSSSFQSLTNALYDKGVKFMMSHDLELQLPETFFDGAVLRISPKALEEDGGALLKLEVNNRRDNGDGRIFFKKHKKKLMMAFFAIMLVVKMIKVKLMFILPMLLGVGAAKKLFLKLLLFVFPAFAHIFKFCAYYHAAHAKYHHHHHQIAHHHHHVPVPVPVHVDHSHTVHVEPPDEPPIPHHSSYGPPHTYGSPHSSYGPPPSGGWETSGPGYWSRKAQQIDENELESWGLMTKGSFNVPAGVVNQYSQDSYTPAMEDLLISRKSFSPSEAGKVLVPPPPDPKKSINPNLVSITHQASPSFTNHDQFQNKQKMLSQLHHKEAQIPNGGGQEQHKLIQLSRPVVVASIHPEPNVALTQQFQVHQPSNIISITQKPPALETTVQVTYDPFYSPILQRMDNVFVQLGFNEEACRERLVCSMYKAPARFSPHSNLISAELSRDPRELQKPAVPNSASVRFHRYVQAARDGQNQNNCLKLYPACTVKTE